MISEYQYRQSRHKWSRRITRDTCISILLSCKILIGVHHEQNLTISDNFSPPSSTDKLFSTRDYVVTKSLTLPSLRLWRLIWTTPIVQKNVDKLKNSTLNTNENYFIRNTLTVITKLLDHQLLKMQQHDICPDGFSFI